MKIKKSYNLYRSKIIFGSICIWLLILEVQSITYLGEADIIRFEDIYGGI